MGKYCCKAFSKSDRLLAQKRGKQDESIRSQENFQEICLLACSSLMKLRSLQLLQLEWRRFVYPQLLQTMYHKPCNIRRDVSLENKSTEKVHLGNFPSGEGIL